MLINKVDWGLIVLTFDFGFPSWQLGLPNNKLAMNGKIKIFGYSKLKVNNDGLLEMSEVSIQTSPDNLRKIAQFINHCADTIEKHGKDFGHEHLRDKFDEWNNKFPDVIVVKNSEG